MPYVCPLDLPLQMAIPLNYLMPATSVFFKCILNIEIQAVCLQIILEQLRAICINRWKGTECSDYLVNLSLFLEGLLFSHYSCYLLSCHVLACACVMAD